MVRKAAILFLFLFSGCIIQAQNYQLTKHDIKQAMTFLENLSEQDFQELAQNENISLEQCLRLIKKKAGLDVVSGALVIGGGGILGAIGITVAAICLFGCCIGWTVCLIEYAEGRDPCRIQDGLNCLRNNIQPHFRRDPHDARNYDPIE